MPAFMPAPYGTPSPLTPQRPQVEEPQRIQVPPKNYVNTGMGLVSALGQNASKMKGLQGLLASKGGILGKIGNAKNVTGIGMAGAGASILGNLIAKKKAKTGGAISGAGSGAATGAMIGSIIPGIGTGIGAGLGALVGGFKGWLSGRKKLKEQKAAAMATNNTGDGGGDPYWKQREAAVARYAPTEDYSSFLNNIRSQLPTSVNPMNAPVPVRQPNYAVQTPYNTGDNMASYGNWG